jgi:V-type H+-transporting ATPase subunit a
MFGDIAHGLIVFCFGVLIVFFTDENDSNSVVRMIRPHRYMIVLMGMFATYCGFIYNDFLSISLDLFQSCYPIAGIQPGHPVPRLPGCTYAFGLDPIWSIAENNLVYVNSLKMKISVIIGVTHMTLGIFIKATNSLHFGKFMDFFF